MSSWWGRNEICKLLRAKDFEKAIFIPPPQQQKKRKRTTRRRKKTRKIII